MSIRALGYVVSNLKEAREATNVCREGLNSKNISKIVFGNGFEGGLDQIKNFSHVFVLYKLHKTKKTNLKTRTPLSEEQVGIFASRSQHRPNHLALCLVELLDVGEKEITVRGLDAIDGSPVLDIKPYVPHFDRPERFICASYYKW